MSYYKRGKRAYKKGQTYYKRAVSVAEKADKALKVANAVASVLNVERNYNLIANASVPVSWDGSWGSMTDGIGQGTLSDAQRVGDQIKIKDFTLSGHIHYGTVVAGQQATHALRIIVVLDKTNSLINMPPAPPPVPAEAMWKVLEENNSSTGVYSPYDKTFRKTFRVLHDRTYHMNAENGATPFKINLKNIDARVRYQPGGTVPGSNDLKFFFVSNEDPGLIPASHPAISYGGEITYVDN